MTVISCFIIRFFVDKLCFYVAPYPFRWYKANLTLVTRTHAHARTDIYYNIIYAVYYYLVFSSSTRSKRLLIPPNFPGFELCVLS